jgi:hypothetical protein
MGHEARGLHLVDKAGTPRPLHGRGTPPAEWRPLPAPSRSAGSSTSSSEGRIMSISLETSSTVISSDRVDGTSVYNPEGDKLGSIEHLIIDKRSGNVRYAVLEFGGFLGLGTDKFPLPWSMLRYDAEMDGYVVPLDKEALEGAPRYSVGASPTYDDAYRHEVHDFYGVAL